MGPDFVISIFVILALTGLAMAFLFYIYRLEKLLLKERQGKIEGYKIHHALNSDLNLEDILNGLDEAQEGIALMDQNGHLQYGNKSLWKIYAIPDAAHSNYIGKSWVKLHSLHGQKEIGDTVIPALDQKGEWLGETDVKVQDGSMIRAELSIKHMDNKNYIGIIRDVSERHRKNIEHENLLAQFYQTQKVEAIGRVLRGLVHDFNNTLSAISGYSELLLEDLNADSEHHKYARSIFTSAEQTKRILDQARMLLPQRKVSENPTDIVKCVTDFLSKHESKNIKDSVFIADIGIKSAVIAVAAKKFAILLGNLIENAIDSCHGKVSSSEIYISLSPYQNSASDKETITLSIPKIEKLSQEKTRLSFGIFNPENCYVQLSVKDFGCGIPQSVMGHIFDPFFTTKKAEAATGMGMSVVQSILKTSNGYITIETEEGAGTQISILLPAIRETIIEKNSLGIKPGKGSVVLVDDQDKVRHINKLLLEQYGFLVFDFVSPYEALKFMQNHPEDFACVFTDMAMSGLNGVQFSQKIQDHFPRLPVYVVTGYDDIEEELPANVRQVLRKPLNLSDLSKVFTTASRH